MYNIVLYIPSLVERARLLTGCCVLQIFFQAGGGRSYLGGLLPLPSRAELESSFPRHAFLPSHLFKLLRKIRRKSGHRSGGTDKTLKLFPILETIFPFWDLQHEGVVSFPFPYKPTSFHTHTRLAYPIRNQVGTKEHTAILTYLQEKQPSSRLEKMLAENAAEPTRTPSNWAQKEIRVTRASARRILSRPRAKSFIGGLYYFDGGP